MISTARSRLRRRFAENRGRDEKIVKEARLSFSLPKDRLDLMKDQPYKVELINELPEGRHLLYRQASQDSAPAPPSDTGGSGRSG